MFWRTLMTIWDLGLSLILLCYAFLLGILSYLNRLPLRLESLLCHTQVLLSCGCLARYLRCMIDHISGQHSLAISHLSDVLVMVEAYHRQHPPASRPRKISQRVLVHIYKSLFELNMKVGAMERAMTVVIRAHKILHFDALSSEIGVSYHTAQLLQMTLAASHAVDRGILTTIVLREHTSAPPENQEMTAVDTDASDQHQTLPGGKVIPFPIRRIRSSSRLSHPHPHKE